jgi:acyl carrier protein
VATPAAQLGRSNVRERVLEVIRGLLDELGSQGALPMLNPASQLDRDLGLGSLERVELLARLETAFGTRLPDRAASEANTPEDLVRAILSAPGTTAEDEEAGSALRATVTVQKLRRAATDEGVFCAETLIDVLRYRAVHDAGRAHLLITEDGDEGERNLTLTFGDLFAAGHRCAAELARRGVPAGGRVALMLPTSRAFFVSYAGILLAGAIPVPIYPPFRADRIARRASFARHRKPCAPGQRHRVAAVHLRFHGRPQRSHADARKSSRQYARHRRSGPDRAR